MSTTTVDAKFHDVRVKTIGRGRFESDHEFDAVLFAGRIYVGTTDVTKNVILLDVVLAEWS